MPAPAMVHLYGSLPKSISHPAGVPLEAYIEAPLPLLSVIEQVGVSPDSVQLVMVNNHSVSQDTIIHPGDRVALFPKEYPIFADWKDHRF